MKRSTPINKGNPVAKHMETFNRPVTHRDRKKAAKRGHAKHRGQVFA